MARKALKLQNLKAFNKRLADFSDLIPEKHILFQKKIVLDLLTKIVERTPVGNPDLWQNPNAAPPGYVGGRARANWQVRRTLTDNQLEKVDQSQDGQETVDRGLADLSKIQKPYGIIWIFNNLPYIVRLEQGWSSQAGQGMVDISLAEITGGL